jgi:hypothetical protein
MAHTTVLRRRAGKLLRDARIRSGLTQVQIPRLVMTDKTLRLHERGDIEAGFKYVVVEKLCQIYGCTTRVTRQLLDLAEQIAATDGTLLTAGLSEEDSMLADSYRSASRVTAYEDVVVFGLLQLEEYARAVMAPSITDPVDLDRRVQWRLELQASTILRGGPTGPIQLHCVMTEQCLLLRIGSADVMRRQIKHLRKLNERDDISIRILRNRDGAWPEMNGPFVLLEFTDPNDPALVVTNHQRSTLLTEKTIDIEFFTQTASRISQHAVPLEKWRAET